MTTLPDTLAALSEAATQGLVAFDTDRSHFDTACVVSESGGVAANYYRRDADARFVVALWNAYRTGQLVPVPSVERVAFQIWHQLGQIEENVRAGALTQDEVRTIAHAVIAAMKEGRE